MVIVAARGEAGIDRLGRPSRDGQAENPATAIIKKCAPSRTQLGASIRVVVTWTTRRSVDASVCVSSVLYSTGEPVSGASGVANSTFEKIAVSVTSLLCAHTPRPT